MVQYKMVPLGELFDIGSSKRVFQSEWREQGVPFYRAREIAKLSANGYVDNELFIDEKLYEKYIKEYGKPEAGDIMVTGVGTLGVCYVVQKQDKFYFKDGNILWFRQKNRNRVLPEYIVKAFDSNYVKDEIRKNSSGTTVGTFTIQTANTLEIPLPDISVQQIVVDKLSAVEKLMTLRKQQLAKLDELVKARFVELFIGKGYPTRTVNEVSLGKGEYGAQSASVEYNPSRPRYVRITDINDDGTLNDDVVASINTADDEEYRLEYGDFMFARMGATVGKAYAFIEGNQIFAGYLIRYKLNQALINPRYLFWYTKLDEYWNWVKLNQSGAAQPGINAKKYGSLRIPVPPIEEQNAFATFVKQTDKSKLSIQQSLNKLELLKKALMQKYFG